MGYVDITCRCGHTDDLARFCRTLIGGELPPGEFQCPACGVAWRRREVGGRVLRAGDAMTYVADRVVVELVDSRL